MKRTYLENDEKKNLVHKGLAIIELNEGYDDITVVSSGQSRISNVNGIYLILNLYQQWFENKLCIIISSG